MRLPAVVTIARPCRSLSITRRIPARRALATALWRGSGRSSRRRSFWAGAVGAAAAAVVLAVLLGQVRDQRSADSRPSADAHEIMPSPTVRPVARAPVPILMYHVIAEPPDDAPLPRALRESSRFRGADGLARPPRLPRRDAACGMGQLARRSVPSASCDRHHLRRRVPQRRFDGSAGARSSRLARRAQSDGRPPQVVGDPSARHTTSHPCALGDRCAHHHAR